VIVSETLKYEGVVYDALFGRGRVSKTIHFTDNSIRRSIK